MINSMETQSTRIIGTLVPRNEKDSNDDFINATLSQMQSNTDGIDIIVDMVKKNKLDPWNIDVVELADKYFAKTVELRINNLHVTSRVILFACILLRLKSDILEGLDPFGQNEEIEDFEADYDNPDFADNVIQFNAPKLDEVLQRRTSVRLNRKRNVTLKDLIKHLEFYESLEKKRTVKNALERAKRRSYLDDMTTEDIIEMAHENEIDKNVEVIRTVLTKLFTTTEKIEMQELTSTGLAKTSVYLAVLFLTADDRIDIEQQEFYSDIYIVPSDNLMPEEQGVI